jgi:hypothetical protein
MRQVPDELPVGARCRPMASCGSATLTGVACVSWDGLDLHWPDAENVVRPGRLPGAGGVV